MVKVRNYTLRFWQAVFQANTPGTTETPRRALGARGYHGLVENHPFFPASKKPKTTTKCAVESI
jgi:hypothetical protein